MKCCRQGAVPRVKFKGPLTPLSGLTCGWPVWDSATTEWLVTGFTGDDPCCFKAITEVEVTGAVVGEAAAAGGVL